MSHLKLPIEDSTAKIESRKNNILEKLSAINQEKDKLLKEIHSPIIDKPITHIKFEKVAIW